MSNVQEGLFNITLRHKFKKKEQRFYFSIVKEEVEDIEGVIRIRKSKKNTIQLSKEKGQRRQTMVPID